jgi:hypothetical protein
MLMGNSDDKKVIFFDRVKNLVGKGMDDTFSNIFSFKRPSLRIRTDSIYSLVDL